MSSSNINENKEVKEILESTFEQLKPTAEIPSEVKKEVFNTLETFQFIADVSELFTVQFAKTELDFLDGLTDDQQNESIKDIKKGGSADTDVSGNSR